MKLWFAPLIVIFVACSHGAPDPSSYEQIVVVGTNDFHGYLRPNESDFQGQKLVSGGAEWFAGYVRVLEKKYGDRLVLMDGGDIFQGTLDSNASRGAATLAYYNLLPYRAAAVGNHEFDYGPLQKNAKDRLGTFKKLAAAAKFPFVQANVFWKKSGKLWTEKNLTPSVLVSAGAFKIGIIGLTTVTTPAKTLPQNVVPLDFRDFLEPAKKEASALRARGADLVFITTHEGDEAGRSTPLRDLLTALPPGTIDAVVAGHTHTEIRELIGGVPVIESKSRGLYFGRIDLFVNKSTRRLEPSLTRIHPMQPICGQWFQAVNDCDPRWAKGKAPKEILPLRAATYEGQEVKPDLAVRAALEPYFARTNETKKEVLATATRDFSEYPSGETQTGFVFLEASRHFIPQSKVQLQNGGGIRRKFLAGPITYGDLYEVHPFDNFAVAVKMNGRQLKDLVRLTVSGANMLPAISGVNVEYYGDDKPEYLRDVNGDGKKEMWERDRLKSLTWEKTGQPVGDQETFWLATNDYLASGGDNTAHVFGSIPQKDRRFLDSTQRDLVAEYFRKNPGIQWPKQDQMRLKKAQ